MHRKATVNRMHGKTTQSVHCTIIGMTNYRIGLHWTASDCIGPHRTTSAHI